MTFQEERLDLSNNLPTAHSLWIGEMLHPIAHACLKSFLKQGHQIVLHVYNPVKNVPQGVVLADASRTLPKDRIIRHKRSGSYALFSDIFRYHLLKNGADLWIDCDVFCVRPIERSEYIFGLERDHVANSAVLAMPAESSLLSKLLAMGEDKYFIPRWGSTRRRKKLQFRKAIGLPVSVEKQSWGTIGPYALTHYAKELGMMDRASPIDEYYPVHYECLSILFNPDLTIHDISTNRTRGIHLYHHMIMDLFAQRGSDCISPSSPLGRMLVT
jgi:hypothetical protein